MKLRYFYAGILGILAVVAAFLFWPQPKPQPRMQGFVSMMSTGLSSNPDMGTYTARAATYATGNGANVLGDGSNPAGGIAPAFSTHPEPNESWDTVDPNYTNGPWQACTVDVAPSTCAEKKFRTTAAQTVFLRDDMIRYYGRPGQSHCHEFFGNKTPTAYSTRKSLRTRNASAAFGFTMQSTAYWEPCWVKNIGGKLFAMPAGPNTIYYTVGRDPTNPQINKLQYLHTLLGFIGGTNMDDPNDCGFKNEIDKANGGPGTSCSVTPGRYAYRGNGFLGYVCVTADGASQQAVKGGGYYTRGFKLADGTDPWEGRCTDGMVIYAEGNAPQCWDGWNVMSPDGYKHFRYAIGDNNTGSTDVCPNGWYRVPDFELKTSHPTRGWGDYQNWSLDSDPMMQARLAALGTPRTVLPGESFHFDWKNGWNRIVLHQMLDYCLGIGGPPHECNNNTFNATASLSYPGSLPIKTADPNNAATLGLIGTVNAAHVNMKGS